MADAIIDLCCDSSDEAEPCEPSCWACEACTFINEDITASSCEVCGIARSVAATPAAVATPAAAGGGSARRGIVAKEVKPRPTHDPLKLAAGRAAAGGGSSEEDDDIMVVSGGEGGGGAGSTMRMDSDDSDSDKDSMNSDDEPMMVGHRGDNALSDFPHPRHTCVIKRCGGGAGNWGGGRHRAWRADTGGD